MIVRPKNCYFFVDLVSGEEIVVKDLTDVQAKTLYRLFNTKDISENIKTYGWSINK